MRASVRSRPSSASVASIGGETAVPVTATRSGCAILPRPLCSSVASSFSAALNRRAVQSDSAAEPRAHLREHCRRLAGQVLGRRLGIDLDLRR